MVPHARADEILGLMAEKGSMIMVKSRYAAARKWLIFWTLFIGVGAVVGAACMIFDPSGKALHMDGMLRFFQVLPFADVLFCDYTFSGWALLMVNGLTNLTAAGLLLAKKRLGTMLGGIFGVTLMLWVCIQFYMFPLNLLSTAYFIFGLAQAITGYAAWVFEKQEAFRVDEADYTNIGTNPTQLVVYFSRMGYVKKVALEAANRIGADAYEVKATERTQGTLGFWWCGRFAMHRLDMPIEPIEVDLEKYDHVTICAPIWAFLLAAPIRSFCRLSTGKIGRVKYIFVHHTNGKYENAAREADALLGLKHTSLVNVRCRKGFFKQLG